MSQTSNILSIQSSNNSVSIPASTQINFVVMTPANAANTPLTLSPNTVNCNGTLNTNNGVALSTSTLPNTGQLGYQFPVTSNSVTFGQGVVNKFIITNLSIGVWIINGAISYNPTASCNIRTSLSTTSVTSNTARQIYAIGTGNVASGVSFTWVITNAITTTYYITAVISAGNASANLIDTSWATCTRIG